MLYDFSIALTCKFAILNLVMQAPDPQRESPLQRLYKTKFVLVSFIATVVGAALMVVAGWPNWQAIAALIGGALFTVGVVLVFFQYVGNEDADRLAAERTNKSVTAAAPAFVASVIHAMANTPDKILSVTAPEVLDNVIRNSLAARLQDRELAADVYADLYEQLVHTDQRWRDVHVDITLTPWRPGPPSDSEPMFVATVKWEFRTKPTSRQIRFACVSTSEDYQAFSRDPSITETWQFKPTGGLDGASADVFDVLQVTVDGAIRSTRRSTRRGAQFFAAELGDVEGREVAISYTYRALVRQNGHLLRIEPARPTKGISVRLNYAGCGLTFVNTLDYIAGARSARIEELPPTDPAPSVQVSYDGWVFPKSAVAFVWGLDDELTAAAHSADTTTTVRERE